MQIIPSGVRRMLAHLNADRENVDYAVRLTRNDDEAPAKRLRPQTKANAKSVEKLWERLLSDTPATLEDKNILADVISVADAPVYTANIENYIGTVKIPVGVVGPIRMNGVHAKGDFFTPLATTEAALVASYARGAELVATVGGITAALLSDSVIRGPAFIFKNIIESGEFVNWVASNAEALKDAAESTTGHGKLVGIDPHLDGDTVFLLCRYTTGDASGQNMGTVATQALCEHIVSYCPITPLHWFIEANFSGDKKASFLGMHAGRGRKVTASVEIPEDILKRYLHTDAKTFLKYCRTANLGAMLSGQLGVQAHYANALAAFYIATGQDAACVSESAVGFTRVEPREINGQSGVFVSVTLPNILVGSVGGGTGLPSQSAGLAITGLSGTGQARALAELLAGLCLCGELSILGAISAGHFTQAHHKLARKR